MENVAILPIALLIDLVIGEYPAPLHPVVWLGQVISWELKLAPRQGQVVQLTYGIVIVVFTMALFAVPVYYLLSYLKGINIWAYVVVAALLLKSSFSLKELHRATFKIKSLLDAGNLKKARAEVGYLVSRDTQNLDEPHLISATVEVAAESTTDSLVAPLFYFLLLGVPGAIAYRVVNTFDARIGYRGEYEYLGKFAARLDDVLNFIPARVSGILLVVAAYLSRKDRRKAWQVMLHDHAKTASPNAGWSMSAAAGALGVQLNKLGYYKLGNPDKPLSGAFIPSAMKLVEVSAILWVGFCLIMEVVHFAFAT